MAEKLKRTCALFFAAVLLLISASSIDDTARAATVAGTIWPSSTTPSTPAANDGLSVEVGVKFRSSVAGTVNGIRFYKGSSNVGLHTGTLWSTAGVSLATVTFSNETASGWQEADFATPVAINANITYVASYHAPAGHYAATGKYFATTAATNGPLTALQEGTDGSNGVYKYGSAVAFPTSAYQSTNYWVDVAFSYDSNPVDTMPPTVNSVTPINNATSVLTSTTMSAVFSEALDPTTVASSFELHDNTGALVPAAVSYNNSTYTATLTPMNALANSTSYTATLKSTIKDVAGNPLAVPYSWSFQTISAGTGGGNLDQGPGGPVLVITSASQPFSKYYAEILRAEGLNSFATSDLGAVTASTLDQYDVAILGDEPLSDAQATLLTTWVNNGGKLIAMHPDKKLAGLLGLTDQSATLADSYLQIDTSSAPGNGITGQTMQYHGPADLYTANSGTRIVATLYSTDTASTTSPAVTVHNVGASGGQAVAFTYDLARSVVYTHQGNPAWAGQERDGHTPIRPDDLFFGAKTGDVQPDYVNLNKVAIPQADEQQRLLSNIIEYINQDRRPLPKLWYFPNGIKAAILMAGDDHATAHGTQSTFDNLLANSPAGCSVANWECYRATSWMYVDSPMTNAQAANYEAQGFDIGAHISTNCANWTPSSLNSAFANDLSSFQAKYINLPAQHGNRLHCIVWSDWASLPKTEAAYNIRMDLNYYYWPGSWVQNRPGFFTGSGIPMRYADSDGSMIDVYQEPSHLVNESGMTFPQAINTQLDHALGSDGYYGIFGTHYDYTDTFDQQLLQTAKARSVPLVSAQQVLDWTDARNTSSFGQIAWSGSTLNFTATIDARAGNMMRGMLPMTTSNGALLGITKNNSPVSYTIDTIKGVQYAFFPTTTGNYAANYGIDNIPPTVTATTPANNATNVNPNASVNAVFSEPVDPTTVTGGTVDLRDNTGALVPAAVSYNSANNQMTLTPTISLAANTAYTITIHGGANDPRVKDLAGNALANDMSWMFTTSATLLSLWPNSTPSASVATSDTAAVALGTKFTSDIPGKIMALRFYKGANTASTHTLTLWSGTGTALATTTTSAETATGWQSATLASPITIAANTTYTVSYFAPTGQYAYTNGYLASPYSSASLHVPVAGGVYKYGGGYPTSTFSNANYWVDVVFTP